MRRFDFLKTTNFTNSGLISKVARRDDALDVQARKADQRFGERAASGRPRAFLHFDQPIAADTARFERRNDVLGLESGYAGADHQHRTFERHRADARQTISVTGDFARGLPVDDDGPNGATVAYRLTAANGRCTRQQWKGCKTNGRDGHSFLPP